MDGGAVIPKLKIIQANTHGVKLAIRFGRKAKNLIDSEGLFGKIFSKQGLQEDS